MPPGNEPTSELPGGGPLAPGEAVLVRDSFMLSTAAFFLHTEMALTNRRFYAKRPNTLFGLIPVGTARSNFPIENIAGINAASRFNVIGAIVGAALILVGAAGLSSSRGPAVGIFLLVIGSLLLLAAPRQAIEVMNSGGGTILFPVSVFERSRTVVFANRVSAAVAHSGMQEKPSQLPSAPPSDPTDALHQLNQLRAQSLISDDEYHAKRADILRRL
jgi:hypothetical protein